MFKSCIRPLLHRCGLDVIRHRPEPRYPPRLRNRWMQDLNVNLVLDVGANVGQYASDIRHWGYSNKIISFEPLSSAFSSLQQTANASPSWTALHTAVGNAPGSVTINVAANSTSSSILGMGDRHCRAAPESKYVSQQTISVITLDSLLGTTVQPHDRVWLKIDVQGYERHVLEGALQLLPQVVGLECELSLVSLYNDEPLMDEMLHYISTLGFALSMTTEAFYDPVTSRTLQLNGVFLRDQS